MNMLKKMNRLFFLIFSLYASNSVAGVITCGDAMSVNGDARMALHKSAQKRAQLAIEEFTGKKLTIPYVDDHTACFGDTCTSKGTPEGTASIVEVYWCETPSTPLHSAYYNLYSSSSLWFDERYSRSKTVHKPAKEKNGVSISFGTGWAVSGSYVVTNNHVISGHKKILLLRADGQTIDASVVIRDDVNDLALLKVTNRAKILKVLHIATMPARIGDRVFTIGYPHPTTMGAKPKLTDGIVSATTGIKDDPRTYQISVPLQAGNSGGPLINMDGEVVGIVTAKLRAVQMFKWTGDLPQNVNYAVKSKYLSALLDSAPDDRKGRDVAIKSHASLADLAESINPDFS